MEFEEGKVEGKSLIIVEWKRKSFWLGDRIDQWFN